MAGQPPYKRVIDLDRVLAHVADSPLQPKNTEGIKADPPKIFSAPAPAILVNIDGEAIWSPIKDLDLKYVLNTNWDLFEHTPSKTYYLRVEKSWLLAPAVTGPWTPVQKLPDSFKKLPADDNWKDLKDTIPGKKFNDKTTPKVFVSLEPAELILIEGPIAYKPVTGAGSLLWVSNTEADLFRMGQTGDFYFLVAGRWFKSAGLDGPWTFATPTLPAEFKQIPLEHDRSRVLASVPGTPQANEAILLASIPRTARVSKKDTKAPEVIYQGTPEFKVIDGAQGGLQQAVNTDKDIIKLGDTYYMCFQGVWFIAKAPTGPWTVADSIPKEIYSIPASSSVNHVTYVTVVEDDNDEWVTFAYVAAYTGLMIGWGCVVWGSGWYYPPYRWGGGYYPYPHTYGMGAWYNPYSGAYGRGYAAYGPYGGVGMGAAYNPRTGTYARGATAYGPYGSRSYAQAYNPRTGTYAQTRQGSNVYGNWGTQHRAARRQLGADRAQRKLPHGIVDGRHPDQRRRGRGLTLGSGRPDHRRPHAGRRRVRRTRRQRLSEDRQRLGTGQREPLDADQHRQQAGDRHGHGDDAPDDNLVNEPAQPGRRGPFERQHSHSQPQFLAIERHVESRRRQYGRRCSGRRRARPLGHRTTRFLGPSRLPASGSLRHNSAFSHFSGWCGG